MSENDFISVDEEETNKEDNRQDTGREEEKKEVTTSDHSERIQGGRKFPVDIPLSAQGGLAAGPGLHQNTATPHLGTRPV